MSKATGKKKPQTAVKSADLPIGHAIGSGVLPTQAIRALISGGAVKLVDPPAADQI